MVRGEGVESETGLEEAGRLKATGHEIVIKRRRKD